LRERGDTSTERQSSHTEQPRKRIFGNSEPSSSVLAFICPGSGNRARCNEHWTPALVQRQLHLVSDAKERWSRGVWRCGLLRCQKWQKRSKSDGGNKCLPACLLWRWILCWWALLLASIPFSLSRGGTWIQ
jgi:hypothetical protein